MSLRGRQDAFSTTAVVLKNNENSLQIRRFALLLLLKVLDEQRDEAVLFGNKALV